MKRVWKSIDYTLLLPLVIVCVLGTIMVYSASSIVSISKYDNARYFFNKQLVSLGVGSVACLIALLVPYRILKKRLVIVMVIGLSLGLLGATLVIGKEVNGIKAWVFGIQPAEFVKISIIVVLARFFARRQETNTSIWQGSAGTIVFLGLCSFLILKQPDLGTLIVIAGMVGVMILCSGIQIRIKLWLKRLIMTSIIWMPLLYVAWHYVLEDYQKARFLVFLNPFSDPQGDGFQLINSFIGIASGGVNGRGLGNSIQKYGYLPEAQTDFIMAIVSEELGLIGITIILSCLLLIAIRALRIAQKCKDPFGSLLAIGIGSLLSIQTFINVGGITGLIPLTGVPLPFVSYGGSSLIANLTMMGILFSVARYVKEQENEQEKWLEKKEKREPHLMVVK
ncbi:cell division protein FtsW [Bacillus manliponensis]|uniref:Probable peptidoglycan glycosyltransferase FtsW n=1 Tax=Bacillus manliponensis TaxID=574376 RepID=A0A073K3D4_9BACI|nr:FtsW/RodA/SpoVE family cell cycle protein [Bacillus manliponensis]KEK20942.1 cell division protein FtsW [Bacillus manliponensis]